LGIGNTIRGDDGIGISSVKGFKQRCNPQLINMIPDITQYIINQELSLEEEN